MWIRRIIIGLGLLLALLIGAFTIGYWIGLTPLPSQQITPTPASLPTSTPAPPTPSPIAIREAPATTPASLSDAPTTMPTATPSPTTRRSLGRQGDRLSLPTATATVSIPCSVRVATLNLREGPGLTYRAFATLSAGDSLFALKCAPGGQWLLVETAQKEIGWLFASYVTCQADPDQLPIASGIVSQTITPAAQASPPALTPAPTPSLPSTTWRGEYYDNASLLGEPVLVRADPELDFNWILDSPAPGIPSDNFSVRWTRLYDFAEGGDYRFFAEVDDGVRLYVDSWPVIDAWHTFMGASYSGDFADVGPGFHTVTVEYFESGGHAKIKVWSEKTEFVDDAWYGEYYNNPDWQGPASLARGDETIDFDWGDGAPADGMERNNFSVRWRRTVFFDRGDYKFFAKIADKDHVKIYLDGWPVVDKFRDDGGTVSGYFAEVGAGTHNVTVDYYDKSGPAKIKVWWDRD